MKRYTTPTVALRITDAGAAELLAAATGATLSAQGPRGRVDVPATVDGDALKATLTQAQTARLGAGTVEWEGTLAFDDGAVVKTKTVESSIDEAVLRREEPR